MRRFFNEFDVTYTKGNYCFYTLELLKAVETSLKILHFVREPFFLFFVSTLPDPQPS